MKRLIIVAAALALAGCVSAEPRLAEVKPANDLVAANLRDYEQDLFTDAVRKSLKDPFSAVFSNIVAFRSTRSRSIHVCGYFNAKNAFGAYVGNQIFYGMSAYGKDNKIETKEPFVTIDDPLAANFAKTFCR